MHVVVCQPLARFACAALVLLTGAAPGRPAPHLPQGAGLAAKYPGDRGIERDPAVIFHEDFERGDTRQWQESKGPVAITEDAPHGGRRCVAMPMHRGKDTGAHLIKWFTPGADTVFVRFYVKFSKDYQYDHHFVTLLANPPDNRWAAFGKAGLKPDGSYFGSGMEPWFAWGKNPPPGEVNLYSYYPDMDIDPKMNKYWGNAFFPKGPGKGGAAGPARVIPPLGKWQCWEFMVHANSEPDRADGSQAMWVDGKLVGEFTGLRWRSRNDVKIDVLWLQHYGYDDSDPTRQYSKSEQTVWFDDIVVSRAYIGPMRDAP
ncbi:MAG TPA: hypothetical protein VKT77_14905 [Chthonomonadaceae bacterium]|nr:hypothetical protein [Chthonomonadaceae bacterium]